MAATTETSQQVPISQWQPQVEKLLRFPGVHAATKLFRPGNPVRDIAIALGAMDNNNVVAGDWVPVARRVSEVEQCCLLRATELDFDVAADGWVTPNVTAEWCAGVLELVRRVYFDTACTALVPFVVRTYLRRRSWVRYRWPRTRREYKRMRSAVQPDPISKCCAVVASGFTLLFVEAKKKKRQQAVLVSEGDNLDAVSVGDKPEWEEERDGDESEML